VTWFSKKEKVKNFWFLLIKIYNHYTLRVMKTFWIHIFIYWKWEKYRGEVELSHSMPRDHIHLALAEMIIYHNHFDHIKNVSISVTEYVVLWEGWRLEVPVCSTYTWWDTDYEDFRDFHSSVLSKKEFIF